AVAASEVDRTLDADFLGRAFGESLVEHYRKLAAAAVPDVPGPRATNVISIAEFKAKFARKRDPEPEIGAAPGFGTDGVDLSRFDPSVIALRSELDADGNETLTVWNVQTNAAVSMDPRALPPGLYSKEDAFGLPLGHVKVDREASLTHLDREM